MNTCTPMDHIYPSTKTGTKLGTLCYCGARAWGIEPKQKARTQPETAVGTASSNLVSKASTDVSNPALEPAMAPEGDPTMMLSREIEHGGYPTSETRLAVQLHTGADWYRRKKALDSVHQPEVILTQPPITAVPTPCVERRSNRAMTLTYKSLSKNGKNAFYSGAAVAIRIPLSAFVNKQAPQTIEDLRDFAEPKQPKVELTAEERKAAAAQRKAERANQPKPTLAEKIAKREAALAKLRKQAAEDHASM